MTTLTTASLAAEAFVGSDLRGLSPLGNGNINDTYLVETLAEPLVLQRINTTVFTDPEGVMANMVAVTRHLRQKVAARGGDPDREGLSLVPTSDGQPWWSDGENYWRMTRLITGARTYDLATPDLLREAGRAFGAFGADLADLDARDLVETIPGFHDTPTRLAAFREAVDEDRAGRAASTADLIGFALEREELASRLTAMVGGELRVTHNDTKLNNVMIGEDGRAVCDLDLDTVMPGLIAHDFGDGARFGASSAAEDEPDTSLIHLDLAKYEAFTTGYLAGLGDTLTEAELESLPHGVLTITYELAMRFLGDYLNGDPYFKTAYPEHNLVRARAQFALLADMERQWESMLAIHRK